MANALAGETSPYLLQHKDNPVDWMPWGDAALERARAQDKPLLVSIGYSACHWCHVMQRESFEDPATAELMNERFVCVKVDREERPDVDAIYMEAVQAMTGHGGWPLHVFLTPEQVPFYGGTYYPPEARHGLPAWRDVVYSLGEAWREQRAEIGSSAQRMRELLQRPALAPGGDAALDPALLDDAARNLASSFDARNGGFGGAPKFPPSCVLPFLLARATAAGPWAPRAREMALVTLRAMADGGIHDQVGGGFHRYAVDATWTVPHFEKMLYDNALLLRAYTRAALVTHDQFFAGIAHGIANWALRELRGPEGAFYSALDADSEGSEGAFYVWTDQELREALGDAHEDAMRWFSVADFEGRLILEARGDRAALTREQRTEVRDRLLRARDARPRPQTDDKRLAAWNGLMIGALAEAGVVHGRPQYIEAAIGAAEFVLGTMRDERGRLLRTSDGERARLNAYLEDHAFLIEGLLDLYEATFDPRWFGHARELAETTIDRFADGRDAGFFSTAVDHEELIARRKDIQDNPAPSGNSSVALGLLRLARLSGEDRYEQLALGTLRQAAGAAAQNPHAFGHLLLGIDFALRPAREVALAGDDVSELAAVVRSELRPGLVLAGPPGDDVPLMEGRDGLDGRAAAYVCERFSCQAPVSDPGQLAALLEQGPGAG